LNADVRTQQTRFVRDVYDWFSSLDITGDFYEHSGFLNYGYWQPRTESAREACEHLVDTLLAVIPKKRGIILDVACGKGATTHHLSRYFPPQDIIGINISEGQLALCRQNFPAYRFVATDATRLDFDDNSIHNMICVEAAFHFDTREQFLREANRVLKPGGYLVLSDILWPSVLMARPRANFLRDVHEYRALCVATGFTDVVVEDATDRCWRPFYEHFMPYLEYKFSCGDIPLEMLRRHQIRLNRRLSQRYLLVSVRKPEARGSTTMGGCR